MPRKVKIWKYQLMPLIVFLAMFLPLAFPIGLPIKINPMTQEVYDYLQELQPGDVVMMCADPYAGSNAPLTAVLHYLAYHKIKWIAWATESRGLVFTLECIDLSNMREAPDYQYGRDWIYLGYIPGVRQTMYLARDSFQALATVDYQGTPTSQLSLYTQIQGQQNIQMFMSVGEHQEDHSKIWPATPTMKSIIIVPSDAYPGTLPYYPNPISGIVNGLQAAGELEKLQGWASRGLAASDALSGSMLVTFAVVILAQIEVALGRSKEKETIKKERVL